MNVTGTPLPAKTSHAHWAASFDRKRRSKPTTTPRSETPSAAMRSHRPWMRRRTLALVKPSPMMARQPPVPNWIMGSG